MVYQLSELLSNNLRNILWEWRFLPVPSFFYLPVNEKGLLYIFTGCFLV